MLHRLPYTGRLPAGFEALTQLPHPTGEPPAAVLCARLAADFDIVFYTDHRTLRLAGLFPKDPTTDTAYFGFWETTDEPALSLEAFRLLRVDARARRLARVCGPLHFSTCFRYRLRLSREPSWGQFDREPVNPLYYPALLAEAGFVPTQLFESRRLPATAVPAAYRQPAVSLPDSPFEAIPLTAEVWAALEDEVFALFQQVSSQNPAYRAVSRVQFGLLYNARYAAGLCPHSSVLFRHRPSGQLAALSLCRPHYQPLHLPPGTAPVWAEYYPLLPTPHTLLAETVGVHPAFREQGLQALLAAHIMRSFPQYYGEAIFCLLRDDDLSLHFTNGLPAAEVAYYALFEREA